jgi:hypothetical protein
MRNELQQIGVARRDQGIFPLLLSPNLVRRPFDDRIHPPRQAVHQSAQFRMIRRRRKRIDIEGAEALRRSWRAEKVTKAGSRCC